MEKTLVIIPARGGSKRIPKKNVKEIRGKAMIEWPLQELLKVFKSEDILVTTDDDEIRNLVESHGLKVPFKRPEHLSNDIVIPMEAVTHALNWYEENVQKVEKVLVVYPTAVLLKSENIIKSFDILDADNDCNLVFSATSFAFPIQRAIYTDDNNYVKMFQPEEYTTRSQDLVESLHDAGQFYLYRAEAVRQSLNLTNTNAKIVRLPRNEVIDIDTPEDFEVADKIMQALGY